MRNLLLILLPLVFLVGCGNMLKSTWTNFNAYYNTFYNAKEHFRAGIKQVNNQPETINPKEPVRVHSAPVQAGGNDFQEAIDKGARVLRKFPDSKWADDAILLIGKSLYYRQEFFTAVENFEELRNVTESSEMDQQAVIWKGRTQLDLKQFTEGISFLESELEHYPADLSSKQKGEIQALIAQHYVMLEEWSEAVPYLFDALENIEDKKLLGRAYFLQGQVLEQLERYGESFNAFGDAAEYFPNFEYLYWSRYKRVDIARKAGRYNLALELLQSMRNDDKNVERRGDLLFEVARTQEMMGEVDEAERLYKELLYGNQNQQQQTRELKGDIYFRLGKIYSDHAGEYQVAAAYFDSASTARSTPAEEENEEDATELADVYGEYTKLQESVNRIDSLLHLGSLSEQELDSALKRIRAQKMEALENQEEQDEANTLTNALTEDIDNVAEVPTQYGFLNYKKTDLVDQYKAQFRVVWGNRPLVDNWRTVRTIRNMGVTDDTDTRADENRSQNRRGRESALEMNIEEIPRSQQQKNKLQLEKANTQYNLGNMLFLNLNMPDSARFYFHKVINSGLEKELRPRAMYSLFELFSTQDNTDSLKVWGQRILDEYPDTRYARRVQDRLTGAPASNAREDSTAQLLEQYQELKSDSTKYSATTMKALALQNIDSELAPQIFYEAIQKYIEQAKAADTLFTVRNTTFARADDDSVVVDDSLRSRSDYLESQLKFTGAKWDSVRFAVQQFDTTFPDAKQHTKVMKLQELLKQEEPTAEELPTCDELDISLQVEPSMENFLSQVNYPETLKGKSVSGSLDYSFVVTATGEVESYELQSAPTPFDIEESFENAFDEHLHFKALDIESSPERIKCEVSFPIRN